MRVNTPPPLSNRGIRERLANEAGGLRLLRNASSIPMRMNELPVEGAEGLDVEGGAVPYNRDLSRAKRGFRPAARRRIAAGCGALCCCCALAALGYRSSYRFVPRFAAEQQRSPALSAAADPPPWVIPPLSPAPRRVEEGSVGYCDAEVGAGEGGVSLPKVEGLELRQVQLTIRHGDRSAIHSIPDADAAYWHCLPYAPDVESVWSEVERNIGVVGVDGQPLERSLRPALLEGMGGRQGESAPPRGACAPGQLTEKGLRGRGGGERERAPPRGACAPGQLTEKGLRQHFRLGDALRTAYGHLLSQVTGGHGGGLYVRSTDYTRTLASAAALLRGLLGAGHGRVTIITNPDENAEVMQGIGLKSSTNVGGGGERLLEGDCPRAITEAQQQAGASALRVRDDVVQRMADGFGAPAAEMKVTRLTDHVYARACHGMAQPCGGGVGSGGGGSGGGGGGGARCMGEQLARALMAESDRRLCMEYLGVQGGFSASRLSIYPFMMELLGNMEAAATAAEPPAQAPKLALYSGHDTVIAPVLAALGAYDCRWPPYASHVRIELWTGPACSGENSRNGAGARALQEVAAEHSDGAASEEGDKGVVEPGGTEAAEVGAGGATSGAGVAGGPAPPGVTVANVTRAHTPHTPPPPPPLPLPEPKGPCADAFVRVVYNGAAVTSRVTGCAAAHGAHAHGAEFCPLSTVAAAIRGLIAPFASVKEACRVPAAAAP
ncbi:histidine phosphatase superfamily [Tribonema minus]|uniref:Histidine phosphatase superfamily n=1 Tax=Tribonema minus TaxID=303371 RepID=A0A835YUT4_9STRA|nr:histidine phosphatase superfamily [Tribonema minus]